MELSALAPQDERLRTACAPVQNLDLRFKHAQNEIDHLVAFVEGHRLPSGSMPQPSTVGLSANQVGLMKRVCVVDFAISRRGYRDLRVLINPRIIWRSKQQVERVEGCVNFPEIWGITKRPRRLRFEALDRWGNAMTYDVSGWLAALIEHEIDHLSGRLFIDRLIDPTHAHHVSDASYAEYRRHSARDWSNFADVSKLVKPL